MKLYTEKQMIDFVISYAQYLMDIMDRNAESLPVGVWATRNIKNIEPTEPLSESEIMDAVVYVEQNPEATARLTAKALSSLCVRDGWEDLRGSGLDKPFDPPTKTD